MAKQAILYAYGVNGKGQATALDTTNERACEQFGEGYCWVHLNSLHPEARSHLENNTDLDPIVIDAMLANETRPRALIKKTGALVLLRAMNLNEGESPEDMISIRIWIAKDRIFTARHRDIKAIEELVSFMKSEKAPLSPCDFLIMITDRLFDRMEPIFMELEDHIAKAEEQLATESKNDPVEDAAVIRKKLAIFIRYVRPQKVVLETLLQSNFSWLGGDHREHLVESLDRVTRYIEELQELRDRSRILNDELNNLHGRRLNEITYIFSVAATIFLPLGFLTGLVGINLKGIPGIDNEMGFWLFSALCILIGAVQIVLFKKKGWF